MEEEDVPQAAVVEKKPRKIVWILVAVVFVLGAAATGIVLGPKLLSSSHEKKEKPAAEPEKMVETSMFDPIVVDVRSESGEVHHLKVGLSIELPEGVKEDEVKGAKPRGRHAAIAYLRGQTFDQLTLSERFVDVSKELNDEIIEAMGKNRVAKVLITDFVAQ